MFIEPLFYKNLINVLLTEDCKYVMFVLRPEDIVNYHGVEFLREMQPFVSRIMESADWPGTVLLKGKAKVFICNLNKGAAELLLKYASSFEDWQQPHLPEDLCFLDGSGQVYLASSTSEKEIFLTTRAPEKLTQYCKGLEVLDIPWTLKEV